MTTTNVVITTTTITNTTTFHSIFKVQYIRHVIFNQIGSIMKQLHKGNIRYDDDRKQRSLQGRDIIKLPLIGMISKYGLPWHFVCHYLPKDCKDRITIKRRKRVISEYSCHPNATLDSLVHLVEWSQVDFEWEYLDLNGSIITNQEILEYIIKRYPVAAVTTAAAKSSNSNNNFLTEAMNVSCREGYLSTVELIDSMFKDDIKLEKLPMDIASSKGFIDIVKYLHYNRTEGCSSDALDYTAPNGHLEIVKFLHFNRREGCTTYAMDWAAGYGHIEIVRFLQEHRSEGATNHAMSRAAQNGHINVVKYLHENRTESVTDWTMDWAAMNGHIEIVKFLHFNRTESFSFHPIALRACSNGDLEMATFIIGVGKDQCNPKELLTVASREGHYDIVRLILSQFGAHGQLGKGFIETIKGDTQCINTKIIHLLEIYLENGTICPADS
ncbi:hypothetical protein DFA_04409 [Cavenderia fasciculata]|uniref:Ankyrin repeat-containing protein n=1 Tax=Cavenderia fasciculata TaxID=261658 RepID=F4PPH8_CACFS|nr:uncharacterized protein DFA_04409 [Cavenderia fasciculata]EGG22291.1 hypothetical protein DFA_04409 [Cavenderia fasciculata]|eukprot:XP_004360142.1 hypothetical protein DFA_04409 [Cavenderia fasciculata]